jgi:hypothetical protein
MSKKGKMNKINTEKVNIGNLNTDNWAVFNPQKVNIPKIQKPDIPVSNFITPNRIDILNKNTVHELLHKPH